MKLSDFNYELPQYLIAQEPKKKRDHSRLLVLDKKTGATAHHIFHDILDFVHPGDLIIMNDTKVIPARLLGKKEITHGKVEILLHKMIADDEWEVLGKNLKPGKRIIFSGSKLEAAIIKKSVDTYNIRFNIGGKRLVKVIEKIGLPPIPPYIRGGKSLKSDVVNYQTVYAKNKGSIAAPTAGLHFTKELMQKIRDKKVSIEFVTLHVGLGTFAPIKADDILDHKMHSEYFEVSKNLISKIVETKRKGGRIIAVGTTTARVLESVFGSARDYELKTRNCVSGWTNIFIYPGCKFKCVDALITNFHLPKSTLLLLVSALAGKDNIKKAYREAIDERYRFYSYGDAMFIM